MNKQQGFAALEVLLVVVVVAVLGFTAWSYFNHQIAVAPESATAQVPVAPQIKSASDLTKAENTLDQVDVSANSTDSTQLDSEVSSF